ncbi:MAG TPA: DUF4249 domain-containing protein, partial [Flavitalea sp.]|nr:DUF4249 domain-containing protein [Flavitalea sp.]
RVRIRTQFGQEYVSDFVPVKITPPIDSISWQRTNDGVHTYVNTHDPLKTSTYYHFEYQEDWIFHSKYNSNIEYINGNFVDRDPTINIFTCWSSEKSSRVITGTTANLESDIIKTLPITYIPYGSWKFQDKYSVMVRQYSLTKEGFEFWQDVKKNSEQLGTIFDPLPSQTVGNIHCITNPQETVIGFISAGSAVEKRIFITRAEVLPWVIPNDCEEKFVTPDSVHYYFGVLGLVPQYSQFMPPGYPASTLKCIDCRLRGSNVRPPFWQ